MHLYFIRHAQSENNALWANTGSDQGRSHDPGLTQIGKEQARYLADFFKQAKDDVNWEGDGYPYHRPARLTHVYCSLMVRAVATGCVLAQVLDLPLLGSVDIFEEGGIYQQDPDTGERVGLPGYGKTYFIEKYPQLMLPESMNPAGWYNRDYELPEERPERARRVLENILKTHGGSADRVALISHGGFYNLFLKTLLGLQERDRYWFTLNNTGITQINFGEDWVQLAYCNRTDFLPEKIIT
jgi:2,3-bisphosphoglycerate-dependent phosphoglycerate mutase